MQRRELEILFPRIGKQIAATKLDQQNFISTTVSIPLAEGCNFA